MVFWEILENRSRQGIEWPEPEKDSGWFSITWMSQNTEVDGSMVNGSVGDVTPIYTIDPSFQRDIQVGRGLESTISGD